MNYTKVSPLASLLLASAVLGLGLLPPTLARPAKAHTKRTLPAAAARLKTPETIGGGTVADPAVGPVPSYGLGGPGMVLVKNWDFGTNGTVKNYADMSANFYYHDQFGTINNGGKYGSNTVSPDAANATGGQPIEGVNSAPVRRFTADSLVTTLSPLNKAAKVQVWNHNLGNGSFMAKWRLPRAGSLLGRDIVWETRVRYVTPPYFWFALWTAGNKWKWDGQAQGAEQDLVESFGYDNGGDNPDYKNYDGRYWHSNSVASPGKDTVDYGGWGTAMKKQGITSYDARQYHIWTWVYKHDDTFAMYCDGKKVQGGSDYHWTFGDKAGDEPINMDFLFDAGWGHNQIGSVDKELPASAFDGKFYEFNYSRVYLSDGGGSAPSGPQALPGTLPAAGGGPGHRYAVRVAVGGRYGFRFRVAAPGGTFHVEDENGVNLTGAVTAPAAGGTVAASSAATLSTGAHLLKWVKDGGGPDLVSMTVTKADGPTVAFVKTDTATQGSWKGAYGADGYSIAGDDTRPPAYGAISRTGWQVLWNGNGLTKDVRAPERTGGGADRMAGQWGSNDDGYDIDCNLTDGKVHQVSLYGLDWDLNGRSEDIRVVDAATGGVLDTQDLNAYVNGKYLVWNVQGHVIFRVTKTCPWTNPALSGIFFDPAGTAARKKSPKTARASS